jgi:hypothetical protein
MGMDINIHDQWAVESQGPIQDRTREHLGSTDRAIIRYRRMLQEAIAKHRAGEVLPMRPGEAEAVNLRGPRTIDGMAHGIEWSQYWVAADRARRQAAPWAATLEPEGVATPEVIR